jgi:nucleotide-binding universal stress UspA family protein
MPILCGTDFSTAASEAARAAARLARARGEDLWLVHVLDLPVALEPIGELEMDLGAARAELLRIEEQRAEERLAREAERLSRDGVRVHTEIAQGYVEEALLVRRPARAASWWQRWAGGHFWALAARPTVSRRRRRCPTVGARRRVH